MTAKPTTTTTTPAAAHTPLDLAPLEGYTPGPWRQDPEGVLAVSIEGANGSVVCDVYGASDDPLCEANCNLIKAAPALLAECRRQREEMIDLQADREFGKRLMVQRDQLAAEKAEWLTERDRQREQIQALREALAGLLAEPESAFTRDIARAALAK